MDRIDMLLDAMEHPEHYSTAELEAMLRDRVVKDVLGIVMSQHPTDTENREDLGNPDLFKNVNYWLSADNF